MKQFCRLIIQWILGAIILTNSPMQGAAVIFDLGGVLIETDSVAVCWYTGPMKWLYYCAQLKSPHSIRDTLYDFLDSIESYPQHTQIVYDETGRRLPYIMYSWLAGKRSCSALMDDVQAMLPYYFFNTTERDLFASLSNMIFDPFLFAKTRRFIGEGIMFVKECIMQGHKVYILSNWDPESFVVLQDMHPEFFELFDGIIISGSVGYNKPDDRIYSHLLSTYNLNPQDCIFIDDQPENIIAATDLGIHAILCPKKEILFSSRPDFDVVRKKIRAWLAHHEPSPKSSLPIA